LRQGREGAVVGSGVGAGLRRERKGRRRVGGVEGEETNVMVGEVAELPLAGQAARRSMLMGSGGKRVWRKSHWRVVVVGERGAFHAEGYLTFGWKCSRRLRSKTMERTYKVFCVDFDC